jgi:Kef-type K+ transport system membrane component KefB
MMPANILFLSTSPVGTRVEEILLKVIVQIVVIMAAARIFATVFRWVGQPTVCGEIAAGLILGPSLFGGLFPHLFERVFDTSVGPIFSVLSQIGLILLLFLIGLEFEFSHLRKHGHQALIISIAGMVLPFGFGLGVSHVLYPYVGAGINRMGFVLIIATALSITALPILGRMLIEFNLNRTRLGSITISAAALDDASGWIILALVTAIVRSNFKISAILLMVGETVGFALFMIVVARPLLIRWSRRTLQENKEELSLTSLAVLLILIFISAAVTNLIGIFSIFGGFIMGAILYDQHELCDAIRRRLRDFVTVFFLPIFFTYTGLRTDIGTMQGGFLWTLCGLVLMAGIVGKLAGCTIAANLSGFSRRESWIVGVLMNTRALMALIAINIGYELGLLPKSVFFMLVFMAVVTTFMTAPIVRRLIVKTELAPHFHASEFMRPANGVVPAPAEH